MKKNNVMTKEKFTTVYLFALIAMVVTAFMVAFPFTFAVDTSALSAAINIVVKIAAIICLVLGAIYMVNGIIKYSQAHADGNGAAEKTAANTIATSIVLIVVGITFAAGGEFISNLVSNTIGGITL